MKKNSKKNALGMRARQRAVAPALVWGREPRGAGRGQTGPKGAQDPKRALRRAAPGAAGTKHGKKNPATQGHRESEGGPGPTRRAL